MNHNIDSDEHNHDDDFLNALHADLPDDFARELYARLQQMEQNPVSNPSNTFTTLKPSNGVPDGLNNGSNNNHVKPTTTTIAVDSTTPATVTYPQTRQLSGQHRITHLIALTAACAALMMAGLALVFMPQNRSPLSQQLPMTLKDAVEITDHNVASLQPITTFGRGTIADAAWSPDGKTLAVAGSRGIHFHNPDNLNAPATLFGNRSAPVWQVIYSPDGSMLAGNEKGTMYIWDATTGVVRHKLTGGDWLLRFSGDNTRLASVEVPTEGSRVLHIWDTATGKLLKQYTLDSPANYYSPSGYVLDDKFDRLVYQGPDSNNHVMLVDLVNNQSEELIPGSSMGYAISDDGRWLVTTPYQSTVIFYVYDLKKPQVDETYQKTVVKVNVSPNTWLTYQGPIKFASDGKSFVAQTNSSFVTVDLTGEQPEVQSEAIIGQDRLTARHIILSPDGTRFALLEVPGHLETWKIDEASSGKGNDDQKFAATETSHVDYEPYQPKMLFSPDDSTLVTLT
ncbi:MAG TPA: WD40 repeat domain-containing protein, partial [Phototrophicaceae bacterium]|nr:WD40 repeat domain-containing protein [Phototrophicaceae bacterium]